MQNILANFGNVTIQTLNDNDKALFSGVNITKDIAKNIIENAVSDVMNEESSSINMILIDNCIRQYIYSKEDIYCILDCIYNKLASITMEYANELQKQMYKGKFTVDKFVSFRTKYFSNDKTTKLGTVFRLLSDLITITNPSNFKNRNANVFKIVRDYAFYDKILNRKYDYKNEHLYLFKILMGLTESSNRTQISNVFKVINTYNGFSFSVVDKKKRNQIFNRELDGEGQKLTLNKNMTEEFVQHINASIIKLYSTLDESQRMNLVDEITNNIYMCQRICDPVIFSMFYHQYLQKRLLQTNYRTDIEGNLVQLLKYEKCPEQYIMIEFTINDMKAIDVINSEFRNVKIKFESNDYSKEFQDVFDRNKTEFVVLRKNIWTTIEDKVITRINEPTIIKNYLNIFKNFYDKYFLVRLNKYACRNIEYNYQNSFAELDLEIGDGKYCLRVSLIQACILMYIFERKTISANDLSETMNVKLKDMNNEINSLILANLVCTNLNDNNVMNTIFLFNEEFKSATNYLDLASCIDEAEKKMLEQKINLLKSMIVDILKENYKITSDIIFDLMKKNIEQTNNNVIKNSIGDKTIFLNVLQQLLDSKSITSSKNDNGETIYELVKIEEVMNEDVADKCDNEETIYECVETNENENKNVNEIVNDECNDEETIHESLKSETNDKCNDNDSNNFDNSDARLMSLKKIEDELDIAMMEIQEELKKYNVSVEKTTIEPTYDNKIISDEMHSKECNENTNICTEVKTANDTNNEIVNENINEPNKEVKNEVMSEFVVETNEFVNETNNEPNIKVKNEVMSEIVVETNENSNTNNLFGEFLPTTTINYVVGASEPNIIDVYNSEKIVTEILKDIVNAIPSSQDACCDYGKQYEQIAIKVYDEHTNNTIEDSKNSVPAVSEDEDFSDITDDDEVDIIDGKSIASNLCKDDNKEIFFECKDKATVESSNDVSSNDKVSKVIFHAHKKSSAINKNLSNDKQAQKSTSKLVSNKKVKPNLISKLSVNSSSEESPDTEDNNNFKTVTKKVTKEKELVRQKSNKKTIDDNDNKFKVGTKKSTNGTNRKKNSKKSTDEDEPDTEDDYNFSVVTKKSTIKQSIRKNIKDSTNDEGSNEEKSSTEEDDNSIKIIPKKSTIKPTLRKNIKDHNDTTNDKNKVRIGKKK
jgi:hypothetical protein